jgi:hypothetical protein
MRLIVSCPEAYDFASAVDTGSLGQEPTGASGDQLVEVAHQAAIPDERMLASGDGVRAANDLAVIVNAVADAETAAQRTEVSHRAVLPDEAVHIAAEETGLPGNLAKTVDRFGVASAAAQRTEVAAHCTGISRKTQARCHRCATLTPRVEMPESRTRGQSYPKITPVARVGETVAGSGDPA